MGTQQWCRCLHLCRKLCQEHRGSHSSLKYRTAWVRCSYNLRGLKLSNISKCKKRKEKNNGKVRQKKEQPDWEIRRQVRSCWLLEIASNQQDINSALTVHAQGKIALTILPVCLESVSRRGGRQLSWSKETVTQLHTNKEILIPITQSTFKVI